MPTGDRDAVDDEELVRQAWEQTPGADQVDVEIQDFTIVVCWEDDQRERFLMARHRDRGWELPGGSVRPGENPLLGAVREFGEETGHRLQGAELVLTTETPKGKCWVVQGVWGPAVEGHQPAEGEKIETVRFVGRLSEVEPLAWPDDPYQEIESAVGAQLR